MRPEPRPFPRPRPAASAVARFEARRVRRLAFLGIATPTTPPEPGPSQVEARAREAFPTRREAARRLTPPEASEPQPLQTGRMPDMLNVLVVDTQKCSSFLVKSILLGKRFAVSIAQDLADARRKAETGLFDVILLDLPPDRPEEARFLVEVHREQPNVPLILLYRGERPQDLPLFDAIEKPIRVVQIAEVTLRAAKKVLELSAAHRALALPVELHHGEHVLRCRATTVSLHGIMLEAEEKDFVKLSQFHSFFSEEGPDVLTATVVLSEGEMLKLTGRVAFAERTPDHKLRQVALTIAGQTDAESARLAAWLKGVA